MFNLYLSGMLLLTCPVTHVNNVACNSHTPACRDSYSVLYTDGMISLLRTNNGINMDSGVYLTNHGNPRLFVDKPDMVGGALEESTIVVSQSLLFVAKDSRGNEQMGRCRILVR